MSIKKSQAYRKVLIMGLGLHGGGVGSANFFAKRSKKVIVTDLKSKKELKPSLTELKKNKNIRYVLGQHRMKDFLGTDLIIQGAGIPDDSPYLVTARKNYIPIDTDIGIFFELCPVPIIGITGSKGKSTTASLIAAMLREKYEAPRVHTRGIFGGIRRSISAEADKKVFLAGNIRISVFDILPRLTKDSSVILELSSWQLEGLSHHKKSPHVAVITNILREHLNKYKNFQHYARAKSYIFAFQKKTDYAILNKNDPLLKKMARGVKSKTIFFGKTKSTIHNPNLQGEHNKANIAAAETIASLYGISKKRQRLALEKFKGLEGRLQYIATKRGVLFYNDTTATMPDATIAALRTLKPKQGGKIILIAGGADKKLNFYEFARAITRHVEILILLPGDATKKIKNILHKQKLQRLQTYSTISMNNAVQLAYRHSQKGDIILLSPGAASFGMFQNEFERGEQFVKYVRLIK